MPKATKSATVERPEKWPPTYSPRDVPCPRCKMFERNPCRTYNPDSGERVDLEQYHEERLRVAADTPMHAERGYEDGRTWRPNLGHYTDPWMRAYTDGWWRGRREVVGATLAGGLVAQADLKPGDWVVAPIQAMSVVAMIRSLDRDLTGKIVRCSMSGDSMMSGGMGGMDAVAYLPESAWTAEPGTEHIELPDWIRTGRRDDKIGGFDVPHGIACAFFYRRGYREAELEQEYNAKPAGSGSMEQAYKSGWLAGGGADPTSKPRADAKTNVPPTRKQFVPKAKVKPKVEPSKPAPVVRAGIVQATLF